MAEIRRAVDHTLSPWTVPRRINLLWDGDDDPGMLVFADQAMLRRLVVNLATNAIRASAEGGFVLIRLARVRHGETIRWSVVDRGRGISEQEMRRVAEREFSYADGEGLGLAISRQLAALQFSPLRIRSRLGKGTEVNFETVAGSPRSVAGAWVRWRMSFATPEPSLSSGREGSIEWTAQTGDRKMRLDPPTVSVSLSHAASRPRHAGCLASGFVSLGGTVSRNAADQFDAVLQSQLQIFDLAYRADARRWVWCLDADQEAALDRIEAISEVVAVRIPGIRMKWSRPQIISLDARRTVWQLSDLLVRQSLSAFSATRGFDSDEVRPGTGPIAPSAIAAARLDAEVRRLIADRGSKSNVKSFLNQT